jgi:2-phospho-L-lactate guanylyltransferase (CobY/MobA/RfbA family)
VPRRLESKGALHHFLKATYKDAVKALVALAEVDPTDTATVYALQRAIHPYFDACSFIRKVREAGAEADQTIEETYGHGEDADD